MLKYIVNIMNKKNKEPTKKDKKDKKRQKKTKNNKKRTNKYKKDKQIKGGSAPEFTQKLTNFKIKVDAFEKQLNSSKISNNPELEFAKSALEFAQSTLVFANVVEIDKSSNSSKVNLHQANLPLEDALGTSANSPLEDALGTSANSPLQDALGSSAKEFPPKRNFTVFDQAHVATIVQGTLNDTKDSYIFPQIYNKIHENLSYTLYPLVKTTGIIGTIGDNFKKIDSPNDAVRVFRPPTIEIPVFSKGYMYGANKSFKKYFVILVKDADKFYDGSSFHVVVYDDRSKAHFEHHRVSHTYDEKTGKLIEIK